MKIGLYFGSFNPVHIGHLIIANYVAQMSDVDQVWLVLSPQNPHKPSKSLLNEYHRLHLLQLAVQDNPALKASDFEFHLPKPSFTVDTLIYLKEKYPNHQFSIVVGSDSFTNLKNWKNADVLIRDNPFVIYNRPGFPVEDHLGAKTTILDGPLLNISATDVRNLVKAGKSIQYLVPNPVRSEIERNNYYK